MPSPTDFIRAAEDIVREARRASARASRPVIIMRQLRADEAPYDRIVMWPRVVAVAAIIALVLVVCSGIAGIGVEALRNGKG